MHSFHLLISGILVRSIRKERNFLQEEEHEFER